MEQLPPQPLSDHAPSQEPPRRPKQRRIDERDRKRAARACNGCRRLKEKCDGGIPCRRCVRLRRHCEFQSPGRESDALPRHSANSRPPTRRQDAESAERIGHLERLLKHYAGDVNLDLDNLRDLAGTVDKDTVPESRPEPPASQSSEYLDAEEEKFTVQPVGNNITHYSGEFSHWNFSMRIKQWLEHCANDNPNGLQFKEYYRPEELQSRSNAFAALNALPPRFVADFLVQAFFTHAETNYYYVDKNWLLEKLDVAYNNPSALTTRDVGTVCVLFVVLAIGTQYAYLDSSARGSQEPDRGGAFSEDAIGVSFYQQASKLLPDVITISSLECVQACLLLGIYTLPLDASGLSYVYLNLSVTLAIQNGMHRRYPGEGLDPIVRETRNRIWWTAYTTQKRVSIFHGRPISFDSQYTDSEWPVDRPSILPAQSPAHVPAMLATLELHDLLGKISREVAVLKNQAKGGTVDTLNRLVDFDALLHQWWEDLPEATCRKGLEPSPLMRRSDMHLRLEYCLVRMFTGRPFIFLGMPTRSPASATSSPQDALSQPSPSKRTSQRRRSGSQNQSASRRSDARDKLVRDCVDAALDVIDVCKALRNTIGLARASYTEFSACRSALLIIITQCLQERTPRLRQALREGVSMIKLMSTGGESARSEASLIEVFERAIARLDATEAAASTPAESNYSRFKQWEMMWKKESLPPGSMVDGDPSPSTTLGPMPPPPPMNSFSGSTTPGLGLQGTETQGNLPSTAPMDWSFASFPQTVDEFSSMFGYDFQGGPDGNGMDASDPGRMGMWLG
ncbi:hypothetical protein NLU13_8351 [Sarocladium strictum]|uniref:Zn(2)-C6 fungal-type domain-containing protein n=1 Tax=Sarocladium strictum TaxID=5046 RepID=A0AA39GBH7_SARSR|nr:hypothetical protein NLU13_8351 [Sarocladium strictum]